MKKWIALTLAVQIIFFTAWGISESSKLSRGLDANGEFLLETVPVDPRDWLSGQYMALRLKISNASNLLPYGSKKSPAALLLKPFSRATVNGRELRIYSAVQAERPAPFPLPEAAPGQIWVRALSGPNSRLVFGVERYYFSEDRLVEMNSMQNGQFYARVTVAPDGSLKLLGLEKK